VALLLSARMVHGHLPRDYPRFYLYAGLSFVIFSLCLWEHFTQGCGFSSLLSALCGACFLYQWTKVCHVPGRRVVHLLAGLALLAASILSFGIGYVSLAGAVGLLVLRGMRRFTGTGSRAWVWIVQGGIAGLAVLAIASHPRLKMTGRLFRTVYHAVLVVGSPGSVAFDNPVMAQNAGFAFGLLTAAIAMWIVADFLRRSESGLSVLPQFATAIVLFGLASCAAVAVARPELPDQEFLSSRYTLQACLLLLGCLFYLAETRLPLLAHAWCLVAVCYGFSLVKEEQIAPHRRIAGDNIATTIRVADTVSDEDLANRLYWYENLPKVRSVIARLKSDRLNIFHDAP